jgi:rhamnulokinase
MTPGDMPEKIMAQMHGKHGRSAAMCSSPAEITNLILHSLAARYAQVLRQAERLSGKRFARLFVVGGGSRNALLNRLTAQATGLEVICGAQESATIGNFALQLSAMRCSQGHAGPEVDLPGQRTQVAHWAAQLSGVEIAMPTSARNS